MAEKAASMWDENYNRFKDRVRKAQLRQAQDVKSLSVADAAVTAQAALTNKNAELFANALKTADALIKQNQKEFEHDGGVEEVKGFPLLHKCFFVDSHGKKRVWTSTEKKTLSGERDVKSRKELSDSSVFKEALGDKPWRSALVLTLFRMIK